MNKIIGIFLLSFILVGCNTNLIKPELINKLVAAPQVKGVQLKSFSVEEQSVVFDVSLYNPNIFPLPVSGLNGDFKLNDIAVGSMAAQSNKSLGAQQTQVITLPIQLNTDAFISGAKSALATQKANYSFNGGIETSAGTLPFSKNGDLSVTDLISTLFP